MYTRIDKCRVCGNSNLVQVLDLGTQVLTGVFPKSPSQQVTAGPLRLVKCTGTDVCGLLQLEHTYDLGEMYGLNYGYRSGLNASMVRHLHEKVAKILQRVRLQPGALVIDIGSNDSTTLQAYPKDLELIGVDPTGVKFRSYYPDHIHLIPDFFSAAVIRDRLSGRKATVITSFSMFYDLERPLEFMQEVADTLAQDGIWVFEQSYMPTMLERNSYDTVCHEHLEYYALSQIEWMARRTGLKVIDVEFNDVNGGSFSVVAARHDSEHQVAPAVEQALANERRLGLDTLEPYHQFAGRVKRCQEELRSFLASAREAGKRVGALGASTKGNVILQYCGITTADIAKVGEVNVDKFGAFTPGTLLPIVPQEDLLREKLDYLVVLPWHFKQFFLDNPAFAGASLVFPLPRVEIVKV
nr:class I SAM-dependent methyltransferase [uncultured Steroidobacter sp.]